MTYSILNIAASIENMNATGSVYATILRTAVSQAKKSGQPVYDVVLSAVNHQIASANEQGFPRHAQLGEKIAAEVRAYRRAFAA